MGYWIKGTVSGTMSATASLRLKVSRCKLTQGDYEELTRDYCDEELIMDAHNALIFLGGDLANVGSLDLENVEITGSGEIGSDGAEHWIDIDCTASVEVENEFTLDNYSEKITCWEEWLEMDIKEGRTSLGSVRDALEFDSGDFEILKIDSLCLDSLSFEGLGEDGQHISL